MSRQRLLHHFVFGTMGCKRLLSDTIRDDETCVTPSGLKLEGGF